MNDMIFPTLGVILEYAVILFGIHYRFDVSAFVESFIFGDVIMVGLVYMISILIVSLWCNLKPFNILTDHLEIGQLSSDPKPSTLPE